MESLPNGESGKADQRNRPPKKRTTIRIIRTIKRQFHRYQRHRNKRTDHQINEHMMARWTRLLGYCTIVLAVIAGVTGLILWKTDETLRNQQRAYMFAAPANVYNVKSGVLQAYVSIGNSGQSIAKRVRRYMAVKILPAPGPQNIDDIRQLTPEEGAPTFAPPVHQMIFRELPERGAVSSDDYAALQKSEKRIYVFGTIFYDDVFDQPHTTEFCQMYFGAEMADDTRQGYLGTQAKYCDRHNDAD